MPRPFKSVKAVHPGRSVFDLSYSKLFTADMGLLYPVCHDEVVPGDKFKISNEWVIRMQPLVSPVLHEINVYVHYFFVPYRLLWEDWEKFISGGVDGDDASVLPRWYDQHNGFYLEGHLWDYLGFPTGIVPSVTPSVAACPLDFPRRAYYTIWNEYYRDENLQDEVPMTYGVGHGYQLMYRNWTKDYFTSALLTQQRGTPPSLPIQGTTTAEFDLSEFPLRFNSEAGGTVEADRLGSPSLALNGLRGTTNPSGSPVTGSFSILASDLDNTVDLSTASTFDIADLRLAFQIQKWMERNNRAGVRYTEFLHAHFGVSPRDERLQRPEYIGGSKGQLIISEVLQTSQTTTGTGGSPQGKLAGHGITAAQSYCGSYFVQEYGIIMGLLSIMPKPMYQQGINRQWLRRTKYDFFFPEFANLSEQAIENEEIFVTDNDPETNMDIFGFQGRYDEMRYKPNMVCGKMRDDFNFWHVGRIFDTLPALNSAFVMCSPRKDIFAVPSEPGFIVSYGNKITAIRPLPISAEPGYIDHN